MATEKDRPVLVSLSILIYIMIWIFFLNLIFRSNFKHAQCISLKTWAKFIKVIKRNCSFLSEMGSFESLVTTKD